MSQQPDIRRVRLLGGLHIERNGQPVSLPGGRAEELFVYLFLYPAPIHSREALTERLWPDALGDRARRSFADLLYRLRRALGEGWLSATPDTLSLVQPDDLWVDVWHFERLALADDLPCLRQAVDLYRGPLLPTLYTDWVLTRRVRLEDIHFEALNRIAVDAEAKGDFDHALAHYRALSQLNPVREVAQQGMMRALARLGKSDEALASYHAFQTLLAAEVGAAPNQETQALAARLAEEHRLHQQPQPSLHLPLVGRVAERRALLTRLDQAYHNRGGVCLLLGDAGIGKSRLLQDMAEAADWRGWQVGWGHAHAYLRSDPYEPLIQALANLLPTPRIQQMRKLVASHWLHTLRPLLPALSDLLPHDPQASPQTITPRDSTQDLPLSVVRLLGGLQEIAPHLLLLEDVHWADPALWPLLRAVCPHLAQLGVLLVLSARTQALRQQAEAWSFVTERDREGDLVLHLSGLSFDEISDLADAHTRLGPSASANQRIAPLYQQTQGNPLLALALMNSQSGPKDGASSLDWMTEQRMALLSPSAHQAVIVAGVLGQHFAYDVWEHVLALGGVSTETLPGAAGELEQTQVLVLEPAGYRFAHDTLRAGVYARISAQDRTRWHHVALDYLQRTQGASVADLLYHAEGAGRAAAVALYALQAGEMALGVASFTQAQERFDQALQILSPADRNARYRACIGLVRIYGILGETERQDQTLETLTALADGLTDTQRAEIALLWAEYLRTIGTPEEAQAQAHRGLSLARKSGNLGQQAALLVVLGRLASDQSNYQEARSQAEAAGRIYSDLGHTQGLAVTLNLLGTIARDEGRPAERKTLHQRAADLFRRVGDLHGQVRTLAELGGAYLHLGEFAQATEAHQQALALCRELGDRAEEGKNLSNLGGIAMRTGRITESLEYYEQALAISRTLGNRNRTGIDLNNVASSYFSLNRFDEALLALDECLAIAEQTGFGRLVGFAQYTRGRALLRLGRLADARRALEASLAVRQAQGEAFMAAITAGDLAYVCALAGDLAAGDDALAVALNGAEALVDDLPPDMALGISLAGYHVRLGQGRTADAVAFLLEAQTAMDAQLANLSPKERARLTEEMYNSQQLSAALARHTQGQTVTLARNNAPTGRALNASEWVDVAWTVVAPSDLLVSAKAARRQAALQRLAKEAAAQGAAPTDDDLAQALAVSRRTVLRDIQTLAQQGVFVRTRARFSA